MSDRPLPNTDPMTVSRIRVAPTTTVPEWADPVALAGPAAEPVAELWEQLIRAETLQPTAPGTPTPPPEPARRWLTHAVAPEAPAARVALLKMTGHIKVGGWLPFRAVQVIAPTQGFVWVARAGWGPLAVTGFDRYGDGVGEMRWLLGGRLPVMTATGPDVTRSAAGRVALDAVWLPHSFTDVHWEQGDVAESAVAVRAVGDEETRVELKVSGDGSLTSVRMHRWSAPGKKPWGRYLCGGIVDAETTFDGITIPSRLRVGYGIGTDQWATGEFLRCKITDAVFLR
jgi:hypothetical protein